MRAKEDEEARYKKCDEEERRRKKELKKQGKNEQSSFPVTSTEFERVMRKAQGKKEKVAYSLLKMKVTV